MNTVLDASAVLALLQAEPGAERVAEALAGAGMSAVNFSEVIAKLAERGMGEDELEEVLAAVPVEVLSFDRGQAVAAGLLRPLTREAGLSLADRACLAAAAEAGARVLTTDRAWSRLDIGVEVEVIR